MQGERFLFCVSYFTFHLSTFTFHLLLYPYGFDERGEAVGDAFEDVLAALAHLQLLPVLAVVVLLVVDEGVARYELVADGVVDIGGGEEALLLGEFAVEEDVHGEVAELFLDVVSRLADDGFAQFVDLLDSEVA